MDLKVILDNYKVEAKNSTENYQGVVKVDM